MLDVQIFNWRFFFYFKAGFNKIVTNLANWSVILTKSVASHHIQVALMISLEKMNVFYL